MNETQFIKRPGDRAAWLDASKGYVGGSEVAALLGLSPWRTSVDVYLDKSGRRDDEQEPSEALRLGTELEDYAALPPRKRESVERAARDFALSLLRATK